MMGRIKFGGGCEVVIRWKVQIGVRLDCRANDEILSFEAIHFGLAHLVFIRLFGRRENSVRRGDSNFNWRPRKRSTLPSTKYSFEPAYLAAISRFLADLTGLRAIAYALIAHHP